MADPYVLYLGQFGAEKSPPKYQDSEDSMTKKLITFDQMVSLRELERANVKNGGNGYRDELQELINRLKSGGVAGGVEDDIRTIQAKRFFDKGFGRELGFDKFEGYLATIPEVPEHLKADDPDKPLLVLLEPRLNSIVKTCRLIGIKFVYDDQTLEPYDERHAAPQAPKWVRMHDGRHNHLRKPSTCRDELKNGEFSGTDLVGVCCYLHYPDCVREGEHVMDLPGSVGALYRGDSACLGVWDGQAKLSSFFGVSSYPDCGASSCRE
ncbi:hypothetical protein KJ611_02700 [Patescibacteria group bacterium]|nr:hypothetical protein [Patescibacteria group bacterium]MBU1705846.1 hypothetical protein [Patescibacteria group bacterium]